MGSFLPFMIPQAKPAGVRIIEKSPIERKTGYPEMWLDPDRS